MWLAPTRSAGRTVFGTAGIIALTALSAAAFFWDVVLIRVMVALHTNDFGRFYYSARAFLAGTDMYAPSPATPFAGGRIDGAQQLLNLNPPHFHLLILPLAAFPPETAVTLWMIVSVFALVLSLLIIAREIGIALTAPRTLLLVLFVLAFSASQAVFITGQLAFLMLLPMTLCWRDARRGRWDPAGAWLGVLVSIKPFLLIFVPYLIGRRRWRALAAMTGTAAVSVAGGVIVFGSSNYVSWLRAVRQSGDWAWLGMNASALGAFQRAFMATPTFQPLALAPALVSAWIVVAGVIGFGTLLVAFGDNARRATDEAFALLLVAAQLLSPVGWVYYLWLAVGPIAAVVCEPDGVPTTRSPLSRLMLAFAIAGFLTPITAPYYFQPSRIATVTVGSVYFWAAMALWGWLAGNIGKTRGKPMYQIGS